MSQQSHSWDFQMHLKETVTRKQSCTRAFIAALFTIART